MAGTYTSLLLVCPAAGRQGRGRLSRHPEREHALTPMELAYNVKSGCDAMQFTP